MSFHIPKSILFFYFLSWMLCSSAFAQAQKWKISDDYEVSFSGTKAEGTFQGLAGNIVFDPNDLANSRFDVSVDVSTISTGNNTKDKHARGESWFFADKFPKIRFISSKIEKVNRGYKVTGELDLRGVKKQVVIPFSFSQAENKATFKGSFSLNREDYGIEGNMLEFLVGDIFDIDLRLQVSK